MPAGHVEEGTHGRSMDPIYLVRIGSQAGYPRQHSDYRHHEQRITNSVDGGQVAEYLDRAGLDTDLLPGFAQGGIKRPLPTLRLTARKGHIPTMGGHVEWTTDQDQPEIVAVLVQRGQYGRLLGSLAGRRIGQQSGGVPRVVHQEMLGRVTLCAFVGNRRSRGKGLSAVAGGSHSG